MYKEIVPRRTEKEILLEFCAGAGEQKVFFGFMAVKIYTRTGDKGQTSLFGGKRVPKYSLRIEAVGTVDELNSLIGVAIAQMQKGALREYNSKVKSELIQIQSDLFEIGSALAAPSTKPSTLNAIYLEKRVKDFEKYIDEMTGTLPALRNFILPGGGKAGSLLHFARTVSRRGERQVVALAKKEKVAEGILIYFNRLSDLLFTMARYFNYKDKVKETIWTK